jgi:anoctamin-10
LLEIHSDEYEAFNDYLEMVIQFGYITMFAAAMPLGAAFSLVFNIIEMFSDKYKLKLL